MHFQILAGNFDFEHWKKSTRNAAGFLRSCLPGTRSCVELNSVRITLDLQSRSTPFLYCGQRVTQEETAIALANVFWVDIQCVKIKQGGRLWS